jgi:3'-5' exoribonuclease
MARRLIADLKPGEQIEDQVFLVRSKDLRQTTQGSLYIHAVLTDRSGEVPARAWQATEAMFNALPDGGFISLKGRTESYKGSLQFIIDAIRPVETNNIEMSDFLRQTSRDVDAMWARVREILGGIRHPDLSALIKEFLADEPLMERFRTAPAAAVLHHAYLGGLLEHTLNVLELALRVIPLYPRLSMDLVLAGLFLHDLMKADEMTCSAAIAYTEEGQLLGHLVQGAIGIELKARQLGAQRGEAFPDRLKWALQHIVVSHHGRYEFGSPKLPAIPEAVAVHYLDNLDAKVGMFLAEIDNNRDASSVWTAYNRALETKVYKPDVMGTRST